MHIRFEDGYPLAALIFGAVCAFIARDRGRSALGWFILGFLLNCVAVVLLLVLPNPRFQFDRFRDLAEHARRLRERVLLDRGVADQRHDETTRRLALHDRALDINTVPPLPEPARERKAITPSPEEPPFAHIPWFYAQNGQEAGPVDWTALRALWKTGRVTSECWVWSRGMTDWARVAAIPGLPEALSA